MSEVIESREYLQSYQQELDTLSKRQLELAGARWPLQRKLDLWVAEYMRTWWHRAERGEKIPPEKLRYQLAVTDPHYPSDDGELLAEVSAEQEAIKDRISALKSICDAGRSIMSGLKLEVEASS